MSEALSVGPGEYDSRYAKDETSRDVRRLVLEPPRLVPMSERQWWRAVSALAELLLPLMLEETNSDGANEGDPEASSDEPGR